jgi:hypothetical protein
MYSVVEVVFVNTVRGFGDVVGTKALAINPNWEM